MDNKLENTSTVAAFQSIFACKAHQCLTLATQCTGRTLRASRFVWPLLPGLLIAFIALTAQAAPSFSVSPTATLNFTTHTGVPSAPQTVTITSTGDAAVTGLSGAAFSNPNMWSIENNCPSALAPGAICTMELRLSPPAGTTQLGLFTAFRVSSSNAGSIDPFNANGTVLFGTVSANPPELTFTVLAGTTSATQLITYTATAGVASNIAIEIVNPSFLKSNDGCTGQSLSPGQSCQISVAFSPPPSTGNAGDFTTATFRVDANFETSLQRTTSVAPGLNGNSIGSASLTVSRAGTGTGTVTSGATEINCGATCSASFAVDSIVTLTAASSVDSYFSGWSGACTNTSGTCTVTMNAARSVTANFVAGIRLIVTSTAETGAGTWTSALTIINNQACNAPTKRIEFNIPAATDPGCNPATSVCVVQLEFFNGRNISCPTVVVDGYTQPGALPNTATDRTNNAQLKIEFAGTNPLTLNHDSITMRGIAFAAVQVNIGIRSVFGAGLVSTSGQVLAGNYFGWRADGLTPVGPNGEHRVAVGSRPEVFNARVGGPNPADRNLITHTGSGNGLRLSGAINSLVEGNIFNLDRNGNAAAGANASQGILLDAGGNNANTIRRNVIANTQVSGVQCTGGSGTTLTENEIFDVGSSGAANARGIELQPGCNRDQTAPVVTSVTFGTTVNVQGTLTSAPNETFEIEFFHNATADTANLGRAEQFIGFVEVTTDATGVANFGVDLPAYVRNVSSTATRMSTGDTSRFSAAVITPAVSPTAVVSRKIHGTAGTFDLAIDAAPAINGLVTVEPRNIGTGHTIVFRFAVAVNNAGSVSVVDGTNAPVTATIAAAGNEIIVTIPALADNKRATVTVADAFTASGPALIAPVSLGFLVGDVNGSRSVNSSDISAVKARSGQITSAVNFRFDVNASGAINASDISAVKARSGLVLP